MAPVHKVFLVVPDSWRPPELLESGKYFRPYPGGDTGTIFHEGRRERLAQLKHHSSGSGLVSKRYNCENGLVTRFCGLRR